MIIKKSLSLAILFLFGSVLSACGFKGPPKPPKDEVKTYPRTYPKPEMNYPEDDELF